jgi:hypothetical protein
MKMVDFYKAIALFLKNLPLSLSLPPNYSFMRIVLVILAWASPKSCFVRTGSKNLYSLMGKVPFLFNFMVLLWASRYFLARRVNLSNSAYVFRVVFYKAYCCCAFKVVCWGLSGCYSAEGSKLDLYTPIFPYRSTTIYFMSCSSSAMTWPSSMNYNFAFLKTPFTKSSP